MQHLPIERLAELGDVEPSRDEAEHLASCPQCARERAAYRRLAGLAGVERSRIGPPLTEWSLLRSRLAHDGIISRDSAVWRDIASSGSRWLRQAAAAAVLIVGGLYAGRVSAGMSYSDAMVVRRSAPVIDAGSPVSDFSSPDEALQVLNSAYERYSSAATYLAANDTLSSGEAFDRFRARLAFLDEVARSTRVALQEAPQDPLINQFYLSTLGARDATLHRLGQVVPVGNRLGRW
jgi:hypothetical protein